MTVHTPDQDFIVFFDIDGVVGDFSAHLDAHGLRGQDGHPRWNDIPLSWWLSMPPIAGAQDFFVRVAAKLPARFLTAPSLSTDCFTGKAAWVQTFLPHEGKGALKRLIIAHAGDKAFMASPTRILIDDREKNIREWVAAGGIGIHFTGDFAAVERALCTAVPGLKLDITPAQVREDIKRRFGR